MVLILLGKKSTAALRLPSYQVVTIEPGAITATMTPVEKETRVSPGKSPQKK